jgi:outer membrane protein assembly factor BamB
LRVFFSLTFFAEEKVTRISISSGTSEWFISDKEMHGNYTSYYFMTYNNILYYATRTPEIARIDGLHGKFLSNLTVEVHTKDPNVHVYPAFGCSNKLFSLVGESYYFLYANDISTGAYIWSTPVDGVKYDVKISEDCKHVYYLQDPLENSKYFTLVKLDAETGKKIWETDTSLLREKHWGDNFHLTLSEPAKRLSLTWFDDSYHKEANIINFSTETGKTTYKLSLNSQTPTYVSATPYFSPKGNLFTFAPRELMAIQVSELEDKLIWQHNASFGLPSQPVYFSPSGKSLLMCEWNYGRYVYTALDSSFGKQFWNSPVLDLPFGVDSWFLGASGEVYAFMGANIQKADFQKCPLV